jgi:dihydroflavonol-4-reductase
MVDLVTGGGGFLGRHIVSVLLQEGRHVRVLDIDPGPSWAPGVELIRGSVTDSAAVAAAMSGVKRVFHTAGNPNLWTRRKDDFAAINLGGTKIVLAEAARQRVDRFVFTSTAAILFRTPGPDGGIAPPTLADMPGDYCRSKFLAEQEAFAAAREGMPVVIVSPTLPIGPGDRHLTPPTRMILDFVTGATPAFVDFEVNMIHVRDVALGHVRAAEVGMPGQRYVLGGRNRRLSEILLLIQDITGVTMPRVRVPYGLAFAAAAICEIVADHLTRTSPKASLAGVRLTRRPPAIEFGRPGSELGLEPIPLSQALTEAIIWLVESGHVQRPLPGIQARIQARSAYPARSGS